MKKRYGCWVLLLTLLSAVPQSWGQEAGAKAEVAPSVLAQPTAAIAEPQAALPAPVPTPAAPYVQKDRTTFFIIGAVINVVALVVFVFWAVRQWRLRSRQH